MMVRVKICGIRRTEDVLLVQDEREVDIAEQPADLAGGHRLGDLGNPRAAGLLAGGVRGKLAVADARYVERVGRQWAADQLQDRAQLVGEHRLGNDELGGLLGTDEIYGDRSGWFGDEL